MLHVQQLCRATSGDRVGVEVEEAADALVRCILTLHEEAERITANLLAPLVLCRRTHLARQVILQEVAMIEDTPEELVHDLFMERVYPEHPLGRTILGTVDRLKALKRATLVNYFRGHYRPDRVVFAVAGDVAHSAIVRELESGGEAEVSSEAIGESVMDHLRKLDDVAYVRFASVYRNFREAKDFEAVLGELSGEDEPPTPVTMML